MAEQRALVRNASDPKQVKSAGDKAKFAQEQADNRLRAMMDTYDRRWWMWDHLGTFGIYDGHEEYSAKIYGMQGQRALGVRLLANLIRVCPDEYLLMQRENMDRDAKTVEPKARTDAPIEDEDDGN